MAISSARRPDFWTKMRSVGLGVSSLFSDSYWLGTMIDSAASLEPKILGISYYGFGVGAGIAILTTTGLTICDYIINIRHQESAAHPEPEFAATNLPESLFKSLKKLYLWQQLALAAAFISCTGDVAGPIVVPIGVLAFNHAPRWQKILVQCSTTLFGGGAAIASVRTYCKNMLAINSENEEKRPILDMKV